MWPVREGGGGHVARLNFKTSCVGVYKCLSLIVGFAVTVAIWPREVVSRRDFILRTVATFWAMSLVGIYPGRASLDRSRGPPSKVVPNFNIPLGPKNLISGQNFGILGWMECTQNLKITLDVWHSLTQPILQVASICLSADVCLNQLFTVNRFSTKTLFEPTQTEL